MKGSVLVRTATGAAIALIITALFGVGALAAAYFHPPLFVVTLGVLNRKPMCTNMEVFRGAELHLTEARHKAELQSSARLVERDPAGYNLWETRRGRWWIPAGSDKFLPALLAQEQTKIYGSGSAGVQKGDVVLDCGAHIGLYTKDALESGAKLVVAIEPAPKNLECLRRNLSREIADGRVIVSPKGVWDKEDILVLNEDPENSAADSFIMKPEKIVAEKKIPLTTIDLLVSELSLRKVNIIKMDIKGATQRALTGGKLTLAKDKPRLSISTEESVDNPTDIAAFVESMGLGYRVTCGTCSLSSMAVHPDVLLFR